MTSVTDARIGLSCLSVNIGKVKITIVYVSMIRIPMICFLPKACSDLCIPL